MSVSRGVLVTMAISCIRIGFAVDCKSDESQRDRGSKYIHFEIVERVNELCIDIGASPGVRRLRIHDV